MATFKLIFIFFSLILDIFYGTKIFMPIFFVIILLDLLTFITFNIVLNIPIIKQNFTKKNMIYIPELNRVVKIYNYIKNIRNILKVYKNSIKKINISSELNNNIKKSLNKTYKTMKITYLILLFIFNFYFIMNIISFMLIAYILFIYLF